MGAGAARRVDGVTAAMTGVRATARMVARDDGRGGTALPVLESDGPLALRRTRGAAPRRGSYSSAR